tara:strand:- start:1047 stop:1445 length:399 start_codon:yes stop_codon:yes gene_type:complete
MLIDDETPEPEQLGVTIEATYQVEEYDILILSAKQSLSLQIWLDNNGYKVPKKDRQILASYIKKGMKFFVAKINLDEQHRLGIHTLRPYFVIAFVTLAHIPCQAVAQLIPQALLLLAYGVFCRFFLALFQMT